MKKITLSKTNRKLIIFAALFSFIFYLNIFKISFGFDLIILTLLFIALLQKKPFHFLKVWIPPIIAFYLYEFLRGQADNLAFALDIPLRMESIIRLEKYLFFFLNDIPTVILQNTLRPDVYSSSWYDFILFFLYSSFFWFWLVTGYVIWAYKKEYFKRYIWGLILFSLFCVLLFFLFPTAPPWYASESGLLPDLKRLLWINDYLPSETISYIDTYGRNDFAAIPSLHVAWPMYAAIYLIKLFGWKLVPILLLPLSIAFATWYGAEHYVIDSIVGVILAVLAFVISFNWNVIKMKLKPKSK